MMRSRLGNGLNPQFRLPGSYSLEDLIANTTTKQRKMSGSQGLPIIHRHAAGIDIGSTFHVVCVPADSDDEPVRRFDSFIGGLYRLAQWLKEVGSAPLWMGVEMQRRWPGSVTCDARRRRRRCARRSPAITEQNMSSRCVKRWSCTTPTKTSSETVIWGSKESLRSAIGSVNFRWLRFLRSEIGSGRRMSPVSRFNPLCSLSRGESI